MESHPAAVLDAGFDVRGSAAFTPARPRAFTGSAVSARGWLFGISVVIAAMHGWRLGDWLVDDAGITFAYARNLASGHGLVSQPGVAPVEGFSNPLWTFLLAPFFAVRAFDPLWTPKGLAFALMTASLALIVFGVRARGAALGLAASGAVFLALDTSFVVWSLSGLENPLLAFLLVLSATFALRSVEGETARFDRAAGMVAGLLALTRPDAVVYAAAYPLACVRWSSGERFAGIRTRLVPYALNFGSVFGSYLIFRRAYFGDWVPNTYHAKVRPWAMALDATRVLELVDAAVGVLAWPVLAGVAVAAVCGWWGYVPARRVAILSPYLVLAAVAYVLMPPDWMGEYRFATGFFIFLYWALGEAAASLWSALGRARIRALVAAAVVAMMTRSAVVHAARTEAFAQSPTVPFAHIGRFAQAYEALAAALGPGRHSLLTPDLGGMLFHTHLRIYDLAGLCDRTIARTLMDDGAAFREYVFATTRPTFIHIHGTWADWAALHMDPRFARDYVALHETWDRPRGAEPATGEPWAGDYVRREAAPSPAEHQALVVAAHRLGIGRPPQ